jgi:putative ABC transport system ATP-binding protein
MMGKTLGALVSGCEHGVSIVATYLTPVTEARTATGTLIELARVEKVYVTGKLEYRALRGVDLSIAAGEMVAIVGPSGSGKSTIINMITGIDRPQPGP